VLRRLPERGGRKGLARPELARDASVHTLLARLTRNSATEQQSADDGHDDRQERNPAAHYARCGEYHSNDRHKARHATDDGQSISPFLALTTGKRMTPSRGEIGHSLRLHALWRPIHRG
jgi:hypothetical protein